MNSLSIKELWKIIKATIEDVAINYSGGRLSDLQLKDVKYNIDGLGVVSLSISVKVSKDIKVMGAEPLSYIISKELGTSNSRISVEYVQR